jgi:phage tail tape-measure protein
MNSSTTQPVGVKPVDPDLAEQAAPGHGVPSQDPDPAAQVALDPEEVERESKSVLIGGGVVAGSAAGAAVGAVVAGPVGVLVGGTLGAVAGAIGGGAAGGLVNSESTTSADDAPKEAKGANRGIPSPR